MPALLGMIALYTVSATAITLALHGNWERTLTEFAMIALQISRTMVGSEAKVLLFALPLIWWLGHLRSTARLRDAVFVGVAAALFQIGFFFMKSAIPDLIPFYADPFLADLDQTLLFGQDAWRLAHAITPEVLAQWFPAIYASLWSLVVFAFPVIVAASDPDPLRRQRYVWLFFLSWVILGNLLALAGSSVGPVYYDQLLGTERYAAMRVSFDLIGFSDSPMALLQARLWESSGGKLSFVSAFPSVHVAVAAIAALYLRERLRRLRFMGDAFFALILLISVYSGYHYLVDGIASLGIVLVLNRALRQRIFLDPAPALP